MNLGAIVIGMGAFLCLWIINKFLNGRNQLQHNLRVIEEGLKKMEEELEKRQKEGKCLETNPQLEIRFICEKMRTQKVSVDVWKMLLSSCSYLGLAFSLYILFKLFYACFWLPKYLQDNDNNTDGEQDKKKD